MTGPPPLLPRTTSGPVPLTFSQRWEWTFLELDRHKGTRNLAIASRVHGELIVDKLRLCIVALQQRHEALRTTIGIQDGAPMQRVLTTHRVELQLFTPGAAPARDREVAVRCRVEEFVQERVFVTEGPLFAALLCRLDPRHHVLVLAMDHMISDGASLMILVRDLWTMYLQSISVSACSLPQLPIQYADFAVWQHESSEWWQSRHAKYWENRLHEVPTTYWGCRDSSHSNLTRMAMVPIHIEATLSDAIRQLSRKARTTTAMTILTVYTTLLFYWSKKSDLVVTFISGGRNRAEITNTIGYFNTQLFLRMSLLRGESFLSLLRRVAEGYLNALVHDDSGRLAVASPMPGFALSPRFNWMLAPQGTTLDPSTPGSNLLESSGLLLESFPLPFRDDIQRGCGLELELADSTTGISGALWYRTDRFETEAMQQLGRELTVLMQKFAQRPEWEV